MIYIVNHIILFDILFTYITIQTFKKDHYVHILCNKDKCMKRSEMYEGLLSKLFIATGDKSFIPRSMRMYKCRRTAKLTGKSDVTSFKTHNFTTTELSFRKRDLSHEKNSFAKQKKERKIYYKEKGEVRNNNKGFFEVKNCC